MARLGLRILLAASMLLAMTPPRLFGKACCGTGDMCAAESFNHTASSCSCCSECEENTRQTPAENAPSSGKPCKPCCVHWCCGGGFVPLAVIAAEPVLEPVPGATELLPTGSRLAGFRPRIEHPPRAS